MKFGDLAAAAREMGAVALITGHYVGWRQLPEGPALFRAVDSERDQSYFLFSTPRGELDFVRFPLGSLEKSEVRRLADQAGLMVAAKPDSQDICFVPNGRYADVIERLRPGAVEPGDIVHVDGRHLGQHRGIVNFTVGQRRGLGIASGEPLFVIALDPHRHRVIVGPKELLLTQSIVLRDLNWLSHVDIGAFISAGGRIHARVRSSQAPRPGRLLLDAGRPVVMLDDGEHGVARGQACVLYASGSPGAQVLGGGWIACARNLGAGATRDGFRSHSSELGTSNVRGASPESRNGTHGAADGAGNVLTSGTTEGL